MKANSKFTRGFNGMRSHYNFSGGVRGKHAKAYARGTNRVTLDPDVAAFFPDAEAVNNALRVLANVAKQHVASKRSRRRKTG
jgi:hypothetical protein